VGVNSDERVTTGEPDHSRGTNRGGSMIVGSSAPPDREDRDDTHQRDGSREAG
jgi:hypothetical protein